MVDEDDPFTTARNILDNLIKIEEEHGVGGEVLEKFIQYIARGTDADTAFREACYDWDV